MSVLTKCLARRGTGRVLRALALALPLAAAPLVLAPTQAAADSFGFYYGDGFGHRDWDDGWRYRRFHHPRRVVVVAPPVYYYPPPRPVVVQPAYTPTCTSGDWRQADGNIVHGVACLQPNGTWKLQ